jgi:hypothetical protein
MLLPKSPSMLLILLDLSLQRQLLLPLIVYHGITLEACFP